MRASLRDIPKPIRTIPITQIQKAQSGTSVAIPGKAARLSVSFGADYAPYLTVQVGEKKADFLWDALDTPATFEGHTVQRDRDFAKVCSHDTCASVSFQGLAQTAYDKGYRLAVPHVEYTLLMSPDGKWLGMLRKDSSNQFMVGIYTLDQMQKETIWFVAVNDLMYGLQYNGGILTALSQPVPTR